MTLRAWIITMRGRIREALVPELQVLRDRRAHELQALRIDVEKAQADAHEWQVIAIRASANGPPARRPLTDEEIKLAVLSDPIYGAALMSMMRDGVTVAQLREAVSGIARAIERTHKITGGNDE